VHALIATAGYESLPAFIVFQALAMVCFSFCSSNLGTLAMERMGPIAGTASSVQGVVGTIGGSAVGYTIGQAYDGTALPFLWGTAVCATITFVLTVMTEPKRLFAGPLAREQCGHVPEDVG
jgi:DHA1 family bicyclomycin/chloramphenicol resistance-like MFS transporter